MIDLWEGAKPVEADLACKALHHVVAMQESFVLLLLQAAQPAKQVLMLP